MTKLLWVFSSYIQSHCCENTTSLDSSQPLIKLRACFWSISTDIKTCILLSLYGVCLTSSFISFLRWWLACTLFLFVTHQVGIAPKITSVSYLTPSRVLVSSDVFPYLNVALSIPYQLTTTLYLQGHQQFIIISLSAMQNWGRGTPFATGIYRTSGC